MAKNGLRKRNIFDPTAADPFRLSRSKVELFLSCARCFYLDRRLGVSQPEGPPFTLNNVVDHLLKKEFDAYRVRGEPHPLMVLHGVRAVPFQHPDLDAWRDNRHGVQVEHEGFLFFGAVDDLWITPEKRLLVVDYKATGSEKAVTLEDAWKDAYKRQVEMYQWLLRRNGFEVEDTGYFVFAQARKAHDAFDRALHFDMHLLPYVGSDAWVEDALREAHRCLMLDSPPPAHPECSWCAYRRAAGEREGKEMTLQATLL